MRRYRRFQGKRRWRGRRRKRGWLGSVGRAVSIAGSALAVARGVKSLMNVEYKVLNNYSSAFAVNTTGTMDIISAMAEGSAENARNGKSVKMTSLNGRMIFSFNSAGADQQICRVIMFQDMHGDGSTPGIADVLTSASWNALRNLDNTDRFKVLKDMTIQLHQEKPTRLIKIFKKRQCKLEFLGSGAAVADAGAGSVWILTISNQASNAPTLAWNLRMRYIDN